MNTANRALIRTARSTQPRTDLNKGLRFYVLSFFFFLSLFVCFFPDVVFLGTSFAKRDILRYYYPVWSFSVSAMKQGIIPLWNPYSNFGSPFLANIQTCVFYPLTLLFYLPSFLWGFNFYILLHLALAGFFTLLWMRECGASRTAALISGIAFCMGGYVTSAISLTISLCALVYLPLVLLCLKRAFAQRSFFWKAAGGIVLLFQYLAGDPAVIFGTLVVCSVFTLYQFIAGSMRSRKPYFKPVLDLVLMVGVFLGLGAFQYLLFWEFLGRSSRGDPNFDTMTMWSLQYNDLVGLFFPYFSDISLFFMDYWLRQSWLENGYAGISVFLLCGVAFWARRKQNIVAYHILLALFGISLALGRFSPVYRTLYEFFPFFKFIRYPARFLFIFHFAVACLAGFGIDALLRSLERQSKSYLTEKKAMCVMIFILILLGGLIGTMFFAPEIEQVVTGMAKTGLEKFTQSSWTLDSVADVVNPVLTNLKRSVLITLFIAFLIFMVFRDKPKRMLVAFLLGLLVFGDLSEVNITEMRVDGQWMDSTGENLRVAMEDKGLYRLNASPRAAKLQLEPKGGPSLETTLEALKDIWSPNLLLPFRAFFTYSYDSIYTQDTYHLNAAARLVSDPNEYKFLNMLNIKYVVSPKEDIGGSYKKLRTAYPANLFRNEASLARAYLVPHAETVTDPLEALQKITFKDFDPLAQIYIEKIPEPPLQESLTPGPTGATNDVEVTGYSLNRIDMKVISSKAQWLFLSELFYPGWKVWIDGRSVPIYKANFCFRAIPVSAGTFSIVWKYDPPLFKFGSLISLITLIFLLTYFITYFRAKTSCRS